MNIPKRINKCPILEALAEIRFAPSVPSDAVFGLLFNALRSDFPSVEKLPPAELPGFVVSAEPTMMHSPHYRLASDNFVLQIGPRIVSLSVTNGYIGWRIFSQKIKAVFEKVISANVTNDISRFGLRYINFFEDNIFDVSTLVVRLKDTNLGKYSSMVTAEIPEGEFRNVVRVGNNAKVKTNEAKQLSGSIVDIDTFLEGHFQATQQEIVKVLEKAHCVEKQLFFNLLSQEFIESLEPEY